MTMQITPQDPAMVDFIRERAGGDAYAAYLRDKRNELSSLAKATQITNWLEQQIRNVCPEAVIEKVPSDSNHFNICVTIPGTMNQTGILWRVQVSALTGDRSSHLALLLAQLKLMAEVGGKFGPSQAGSVYQFVSDDESAARGERYVNLPVIMLEPTDLNVCTGHVGVVNYRCKLSPGKNANMNGVELFPFVVLSLESESRRLKRETNSPGFDASHVYSNHGTLGSYGQHPAITCDRVAIELTTRTNANPDRLAMKLTQFLEEASTEYVTRYAPNNEVNAKHFDITVLPSTDAQNFRVNVYGQTGHPAAQTDNAITKAALLFGGLLKMSGKYPGIQAYGRLADNSVKNPKPQSGLTGVSGIAETSVLLQGLQTLTPTHLTKDVQKRMTEAATDAVKKYCKLRSRKYDASMIEMTFNGVSSEAFPPTPIATAQALQSASNALGYDTNHAQAWPVWCAGNQRTSLAIFGPGKISRVAPPDLEDLQKALEISVLATRTINAK